jgi:hypothetical protein
MKRAPAATDALCVLSANSAFPCLEGVPREAVNPSGSAHYFGFAWVKVRDEIRDMPTEEEAWRGSHR